MDHLLQPAVAQLAIAFSVFSLITYLWLGVTVLLIGNRGSRVTWLSGIGLLTAALFFLCHGALVGAGVPQGPSPVDVWWRLAWVPAFAAPILWAATGMHYVGLTESGPLTRRLRRPALIAVGVLGGVALLLALLSLPAIGHYGDFIWLLGASLRLGGAPALSAPASPLLPVLALAFITYMIACASLPWASLAVRRLRPVPATSPATATSGMGPGGQSGAELWDAADAWSRARPALLGASLCMIVAGAVAAVVGVAASVGQERAAREGASQVGPILVPSSPPGHVPLVLVAADLIVQVALAGLGLMLGWAVVRQGVLVERQLPQRGFFRQWRGTAAVALVLAGVVSWMAYVAPEALPYLLVLVTLFTGTYALFTWQTYGEHDRLLRQLRPFAASLSVGHAGWLASDADEVERSVEALFASLCRDVLGAAWGRLSLSAGRLHRTFAYSAPVSAHHAEVQGREWSLPVMDEHGVVARLVLGPRVDGAGYTAADLEIARTCGQRILDAVGEYAATQAVASLARRRGLEAELSAALPRRVLHDEVLPRLHLAMLRLEALRSRMAIPARTGVGAGRDGLVPGITAEVGDTPDTGRELGDVVAELGRAHRDLAALMRAAPAANPRRVEHGLVGALRSSLDGEFRGTFDGLEWDVPADAALAADALPATVADLLLGAALEAIRNAGRHGRGGELHRKLELRVAISADERSVTVMVADDGVGVQVGAGTGVGASAAPGEGSGASAARQEAPGDTTARVPVLASGGTRTGLLTHGALVALVGGALTVRSTPGEGTTVTIRMPRAPDNAEPTSPSTVA
ncbi:MAG TPA: ATP-binding protein [Ktedonobacterales bacterium]|nr:ATP-binding protein [Ktedonobacterales bacterium]